MDEQDWFAVEWDGGGEGDNAPHLDQNVLGRLRRGSPGLDSGPLGWPLFHCRTAPGQHQLPIWRKLVPRKSRLETKSENEARSALLARLWCHLILQNPANRAENLTRLCSATIGQTGWRMAQSGAIRSLGLLLVIASLKKGQSFNPLPPPKRGEIRVVVILNIYGVGVVSKT